MNDEKLIAIYKALKGIDSGITLNSLRLDALEHVLKLNYPELDNMYQQELYRLLKNYQKEHPNFLPPNFSE